MAARPRSHATHRPRSAGRYRRCPCIPRRLSFAGPSSGLRRPVPVPGDVTNGNVLGAALPGHSRIVGPWRAKRFPWRAGPGSPQKHNAMQISHRPGLVLAGGSGCGRRRNGSRLPCACCCCGCGSCGLGSHAGRGVDVLLDVCAWGVAQLWRQPAVHTCITALPQQPGRVCVCMPGMHAWCTCYPGKMAAMTPPPPPYVLYIPATAYCNSVGLLSVTRRASKLDGRSAVATAPPVRQLAGPRTKGVMGRAEGQGVGESPGLPAAIGAGSAGGIHTGICHAPTAPPFPTLPLT